MLYKVIEVNCFYSFVIAIVGGSGAGKTELVKKLDEKIKNSSRLIFDDNRPNYEDFTRDVRKLKMGQKIEYILGN